MALMAWTEAFSSFTPAGTGWQDYDIFTNKSVPKGAIACIIATYNSTGTTTSIGVRADGSSLSRYVLMAPYAQSTGVNGVMMYVKVDSSTGLIETYASATANVTFYLVGYWTGVDFTEKFDSAMPGSASAWTDVNLNTISGVPAGQVASVLLADKYSSAYTMGVRINGSSVVRSVPIRSQASGGAQTHSVTMQVKTDGSGIVEVYTGSTTNTLVYCLGYFGPEMDYIEDIQTGSIGSTGWTDWDITSYIVQDGRVADVICANNRNGAYVYSYGVRINGSSLSRYLIGDRGDGTGYSFHCYPTGTDASGILELYGSNSSYEYFRYLGAYKQKVAQTQITKTVDAKLIGRTQLTKTIDATLAIATGTIASDLLSATGLPNSRKVFYVHGRHWVFTVNTNSQQKGFYLSSADGITWSTPAIWNDVDYVNDNKHFAVHYDGRYFHLVYAVNYSGTYFRYKRGYPNLDGTITWDSEQQVAFTAASYYILSLTTNSDGNVFFTCLMNDKPYVYKNANTDGTWATAANFPYELSATTNSYWAANIVPLASGNILALYVYNGVTVKSKLWTESTDTWAGEVAASTSLCYVPAGQQASLAAVSSPDTGEVHIAFLTTVTYDLYYRRRNSAGTWQTEEWMETCFASMAPCLGFDETNNDLYLFTTNQLASGTVAYWKRSSAGSWSGAAVAFVTGQTNLLNSGMTGCNFDAYGKRLGVIWFTGTGSPYTEKIAWLTFGNQPLISKTIGATLYSDKTKTIQKTINARLKGPKQVTKAIDAAICWPFTYVKSHAIGSATGAGTNYQVKVKVFRGAGSDSGDTCYNIPCSSDFHDLRFLDSTGAVIDSWCESVNGTTDSTWWVEIRDNISSTGTTIYVAVDPNYNYPFGADQTEMDATFPLAEHFYGANTSAWVTARCSQGGGGKPWAYAQEETIASSIAKLVVSEAYPGFIQSDASFALGYAIRTKWRLPNTGMVTSGDCIGFGFGQMEVSERVAIGAIKALGVADYGMVRQGSGGSSYTTYIGTCGLGTGSCRALPDSTYHIDEIRRTSTQCKFILNLETGSPYYAETDTTRYPAGSKQLILSAYESYTGGGAGYLETDWILIRKFVETEPAHGAWGTLTKRTSMNKKINATLTGAGGHKIYKTIDADLKGPKQTSKTVNARLRKSTALSKAIDARLKKVQSTSKTIDARLKKTGNQITKNVNADLKGPLQKTKNIDARLKKSQSTSKVINARLKKSQSTTKTLDARLKKAQTLSKTIDAKLRPVAKTKTIDARLKKAQSTTKAIDARLKKSQSTTKAIDARLKKSQSTTKTINATLIAGVVQHQLTKTINSRLKAINTLSKTIDSRLKKSQTATKTIDARLLKPGNQLTKPINARLKKSTATSKTIDARLKKLGSQLSKTVDARIKKTGIQLTKTINATLTIANPPSFFYLKGAIAAMVRLRGRRESDPSLLGALDADLQGRERPKVYLSGVKIDKYLLDALKQ